MSNHRPYPIKPPTSPINLPKLEPSPIDEATAAYNNQIKVAHINLVALYAQQAPLLRHTHMNLANVACSNGARINNAFDNRNSTTKPS